MSVIIAFMCDCPCHYFIAEDSHFTRSEVVLEIKLNLLDVQLIGGTTGLFESVFTCMKSPLLSFWRGGMPCCLHKWFIFFFFFAQGHLNKMNAWSSFSMNLSNPVVESSPHYLNTSALPCFLVCYRMLEGCQNSENWPIIKKQTTAQLNK